MIASFKHKGLRLLFEKDDPRRVSADHAERLRLILSALDQAGGAKDMDQPAFRPHPLKGDRKGRGLRDEPDSAPSTAFRFEACGAFDVDLEDYH